MGGAQSCASLEAVRMDHRECRSCTSFPADHDAPALARQAVDRVLGDCDTPCERIAPLVRLLTSELVTNAVRHGGAGVIALHVQVHADRVGVAVEDSSAAHPRVGRGGELGGWGVALIDAHATAWGFAPTAGGKVVWFQTAFDAVLPPSLDRSRRP